ncbi:hypothetical protein BDR03DRAFT_982322 [Suillus americanus]|nr:hypothetical protein BDR03DRAFT_982322 [Suillus americanus]
MSKRIGTGKEIMCLTYDHSGNDTCIATGTHDKCVQVWSFDFKGPLIPVFSIELSTTIPYMINFNRTASRHLLVFGMYDGEVYMAHSVIVGATSQNNVEPIISIWSHQQDNHATPRCLGTTLKHFAWGIVQLAIAMALLTYVSNLPTYNEQISDPIHVAGKYLAKLGCLTT